MSIELLDAFDEQIQTVPQALYMISGNFPGRPVNMFKEDGEWKTISYAQLIHTIECIGISLTELGIEPGDLIGIKGHTSARWTWADLGSMFAAAATVSIYPSLSRQETAYIANHSEMKALFVDDIDILTETLMYAQEMPNIKYYFVMEKGFKGNGKNIFGLDEMMEMGEKNYQISLPLIQERIKNLTGAHNATMVYTSGTTGVQKGAMHSHKNILDTCSRGYRHLATYGRPSDYNMVSLCMMPISHVMGKLLDYFCPLMLGGCIGFSAPATFMADIQIIRPTWMTPVPRILSRMYVGFERAFGATESGKKLWDWAMDVGVRATYALEDENGHINTNIPYPEQLTGQLREEWIKAYNMVYWRIHEALGGRLRDINPGGAYLDPELQRKLMGMGLYIALGYGLTETCAPINEGCPSLNKIGWISPPNHGVEEKLDEDGEILVRGNGIITSYYKNEEANEGAFTPDGFFRTGDIGEFDEFGYLRIVDRKKNLIVLDTGKNIAAGRLEGLCFGSPLIDQVVLLGQDRKFVGALVIPAYDHIVNALRSNKIPFDESQVKYGMVNGMKACIEVGEDVISNPVVKSFIDTEIQKVNDQVEGYETIKQYRILPRRLSEEAGEITPTQKIKNRVVYEKYKDIIEEIYR